MYSEPFKALYNKSSLIEFIVRMFWLIYKPKINPNENLKEGQLRKGEGILRFGLWEIYLSCTLMIAISVIFDVVFGTSYKSILGILKSEIVIPLEYGYHAVVYTVLFFIAIFLFTCLLKLCTEKSHINVVKTSYFLTLQYARLYSLFMFVFYFFVLEVFEEAVRSPEPIESLVNQNTTISNVIFLSYIILYFRCLVNPIRHYIGLEKWRHYPAIILITICPMFFTDHIPKVIDFSLNEVKLQQLYNEQVGNLECK